MRISDWSSDVCSSDLLSAPIARLDTTSVTLADGRVLRAGTVLDARGAGDLSLLDLGWQKFFGQELLIEGGHGLARPIIMDARVPQIDGYRFVYLLPFSPDRLFVDDPYFSDGRSDEHTSELSSPMHISF